MIRGSKRVWTGGIGTVGLLAGVVALVGTGPTTTPTAAAAPTGLPSFDDCEQLRSSYVEAALPHVTAWGWDFEGPPVVPLMADTRAEAAPLGETDAVGNGATGTNLQEAGVDEPDLAKTDGEIVALVRHGDLIVFDTSGEKPREIGRLDLPDRLRISELLLVGDRAVLLGSSGGGYGHELRMIPVDGPYAEPKPSRTALATVDLSDPTAPSVVRTEVIDGELISARAWDSVVRVVTTSTPDLDFVHPTRQRTVKQAAAKNRQIVRQATVGDWLPASRVDGGPRQALVDCADVRRPRGEPAGLGTISVLTMDPTEPESSDAIGVAADGNLAYASDDRLYVATTDDGWWDWTWRADDEPARTDIHGFTVDGAETTYIGSGDVPGRVPDRWAFSEHNGGLRVASTVGPQWRPRETRVTVLDERDGRLPAIGSVGGMGKNEQIEAVRWFGDIAVVVTFRQVDPLYTLDLSDPGRPTVEGELKIPGFSGYLHPIGDSLLLGVGQDGTASGRLKGGQISSFDLGDLAKPSRLDMLGFGRVDTRAVTDSRGFTYLPEQRLAFVPTGSWRRGPTLEMAHVAADGQLSSQTSTPLPGRAGKVRVLPLDDGRIAIVAAGDLIDLADPTAG